MDARHLVQALGGRWLGRYGMARCPAHIDRTPSLAVAERDGRLLVRCHAGCDQRAVIDALQMRHLWRTLEARDGSWTGGRPAVDRPAGDDPAASRKRNFARRVWENAHAATESPVEVYLRGRGITLPLPSCLKFVPSLRHGQTGRHHPAMIAGIQGPRGEVEAIHRTYLAVGDRGVGKADCSPVRMMLGSSRSGAVRLAPADRRLALAEGIETALSVLQATGMATWATLGTSGLRSVVVPDIVREVVICADGDGPGQQAAQDAAQRFLGKGRRVRIAMAPAGQDFNDMLVWPDHIVPFRKRHSR